METEGSIRADLRRLGLAPGDTVLVHASMRRLGRVRGGPAAVVAALRSATGPDGTLVAPAFTAGNSLTSSTHLRLIRGLSAAETAAFRSAMRPFDPATSPTTDTGSIAERLRTTPGAMRSSHPTTSFTALGPLAELIVSGHADDCLLGERSPLARLYEIGARVLLLGVGFRSCTAFHLAEYRLPDPPRRCYTCRVKTAEGPRWHRFRDVDLDDRDFALIGSHLERDGGSGLPIARGPVGETTARLLPLAAAVDAAAHWMSAHRRRPAALGGE